MNTNDTHVTRRSFLSRCALFSGVAAAPCILPSSIWSADGNTAPSGRITVGLIGRGLMGRGHFAHLLGTPEMEVLAVCDADRTRCEEGRTLAEQTYAASRARGSYRACKAYNDYREILGRPEIDAVVIATPDHWHSLQAIHAAKAGKDVYCEKPVSLTLQQGRQLADTVRRYGRVFQTGTQYRSIPTIRQVCEFVRTGGLGKVTSVFTIWNSLGGFIGSERFKPYAQAMKSGKANASPIPLVFDLPAEPPPEGLDWDLWVGPAAWHPYNRLYHINPSPGVVPWSFCEDFGAASITWHQSHSADVIQYALGMETSGPVEIIHPNSKQYPTLTCKYANGTLQHFVEHWGVVKDVYKAVPPSARLEGLFGGVFVGEKGWVTSNSVGGKIEAAPESLFREMNLKTRDVVIGANNHHANWIECIRARRQPSSHEEIGHRSASLGHLVSIAFKLERSLKWDPIAEQFPGDDEANRLRSRALRTPWQA